MDRLMDWLPAHMPASARDESQVSVVHGDYRLDNLIFHPTEPRMLAVLDWELSTLGHPLADFSYHCMSWHIPPGVFRGIGGLDLAALGIPAEATTCAATASAPAAPTRRLMADWNFYLAYNLFRLAAITQGIAKRVVDGTAASAQARATGAATRPLAEWAGASPRPADNGRGGPHGLQLFPAHAGTAAAPARLHGRARLPGRAGAGGPRSRPTPPPASAGRRCR
jgi:aminoglycoside phosphotransferase (APT) family kinase protein